MKSVSNNNGFQVYSSIIASLFFHGAIIVTLVLFPPWAPPSLRGGIEILELKVKSSSSDATNSNQHSYSTKGHKVRENAANCEAKNKGDGDSQSPPR